MHLCVNRGRSHSLSPAVRLAMNESRRFPPPWSSEDSDACFIVRDRGGQALAYVYFEDAASAARNGIVALISPPT
jgi:hypothetical protein